MNKNTKLSKIIETGKKYNENETFPSNIDKVKLKIDIFNFCEKYKNCFITSKEFNYWKDSVKEDDKSSEIPEWMLSPILIFAFNKKDFTKELCDYLLEKNYKYIRSKNDVYPQRLTIEVEFEPVAHIQENNSYLEKHLTYQTIYGAKFNTNDFLMLPLIYYEYITPIFNYESWGRNVEIEEKTWEKYNIDQLNIVIPDYKNINADFSKVLKMILNENENDFLFSGLYSLTKLLEISYEGPITIFHKNPLEFLKRLNDLIPSLKVKEEESIFYFYNKKYFIYNSSDQLLLELYDLNFGFNYIRIGLENHTNYHGIILTLILKYLEEDSDNSKKYINLIKLIFAQKKMFLKKNNINSCLEKSIYQVFQDKIIGTNDTPFLKFKLLEWNKELDFFYRPDIKEDTTEEKQNNSTENVKE